MPALISNKTNLPLTKPELVKTVGSAVALSVLGTVLSFLSIRQQVAELVAEKHKRDYLKAMTF